MALTHGKWIDPNSVRYTAALSWSGSGPYTMAITSTTHKRGLNPIVTVRVTDSGTSTDCTWDVSVTDSNGNITITSTENFTGKVIIL